MRWSGWQRVLMATSMGMGCSISISLIRLSVSASGLHIGIAIGLVSLRVCAGFPACCFCWRM